MRKYLLILFFGAVILKIYSLDTFFCIDGPLRIRNAPSVSSIQIGSLNLFDEAYILEKIENKVTIDNIADYWYKIQYNEIEGYAFGGYGIILKEIYEIKTIDDFIKTMPDTISIKSSDRYLYNSKLGGELPIIQLRYSLTLNEYYFSFYIYFRPKYLIDINETADKLNLEISTSGNYFGRGDSYTILKNDNLSEEILTRYGNRGRYFFMDWASGTSRDIGNFLFEIDFAEKFDGIIITGLNMWTNYSDKNIRNITTQFIRDAREKRIKESIIYQILHEIVLRMKIIS